MSDTVSEGRPSGHGARLWRRSLSIAPVHAFTGAISLLGLTVLALALAHLDPAVFSDHTKRLRVVLLGIGVIVSEMFPVKIPRRGDNEEITVSTTFSFALLITAGLAPALIAQAVASLMQDLSARKPWWRMTFNVGQYSLCLAAAALVLGRFTGSSALIHDNVPVTSLLSVLGAAALFFLMNAGVVGIAVALYQRESILGYLRRDILFTAGTGLVLLSLAPIAAEAVQSSPDLFPLFAFPLFAVYLGGKAAARTQYQARHDPLTGLPNRTAFHDFVRDALDDRDGSLAVLLMDLDGFKEINDSLGHHYGDLVLEQIGTRLLRAVRPRDFVARLGGDEFAVCLLDTSEPADAKLVAARITAALATPFEMEGIRVGLEASIGVAHAQQDARDANSLLRRADVAMYHAKETHSRVSTYRPELDHNTRARLTLIGDLRNAIERNELFLAFQPKVDLVSGELVSVEALVRWRHPSLGVLQPDSFVPIAERNGLVGLLTAWVLDTAVRQARQWLAEGRAMPVAVNISARSATDLGFPAEVQALLRRYDCPPRLLTLEVTESMIMTGPVSARHVLTDLTQMGVAIALDDYGTGHSSLGYIKDLPVSELKIDKSFVTDMKANRSDAAIVRSTVDLGHNLGLDVVAEGVEDADTLAELKRVGCDIAQGYFVAPPLDAGHVGRFLRPQPGCERGAVTPDAHPVARAHSAVGEALD